MTGEIICQLMHELEMVQPVAQHEQTAVRKWWIWRIIWSKDRWNEDERPGNLQVTPKRKV